jgi:hypothetical protein
MKLKKPKKQLSEYSIVRLREINDELVHEIAERKKEIDAIKAELSVRYAEEATREILSRGKEHGEYTLEKDGVKITCDIGQKITWDSDMLKEIAQTLPQDTVHRLFKISISVPERVFQSITEKELLDRVSEARTVRYEQPKFTFNSPKE